MFIWRVALSGVHQAKLDSVFLTTANCTTRTTPYRYSVKLRLCIRYNRATPFEFALELGNTGVKHETAMAALTLREVVALLKLA
jgi:hypothetical protein